MTAATFVLPDIRPDWMLNAACRGHDPELWYPEPGDIDKQEQALRICASCPVQKSCLEWAFETDDRWAVLGGKTMRQRTSIRQRMERLGRWPKFTLHSIRGHEQDADSQ